MPITLMQIYTIGHSTREKEEFTGILKSYGIHILSAAAAQEHKMTRFAEVTNRGLVWYPSDHKATRRSGK